MNAMDRLDGTLADMDDLLQQADDQTIDECLKRGIPADYVEVDTTCSSCGHAFHGLACPPNSRFVSGRGDWFFGIDDYALETPEPGDEWWPCPCETSLAR